jgi:tetratricopeptide (TPR) repeat protein
MGCYNNAIRYFTKATNVDPENVHNLIKRAVIYYILQECDKALLDLNKVIQLDISNSLAFYYIGLTYCTMKDIRSSIIAFDRCLELDPYNDLAKLQLLYLWCLMNESFDYNIITKINIRDDVSLLFIRCNIYIELKKYEDAKVDLVRLFKLGGGDISFIYLFQEFSDFWAYLCEYYNLSYDIATTRLGITNNFENYMYMSKYIYNLLFIN